MFAGLIIVFSFFFGLLSGQEYISLLAGISAYFAVFGAIEGGEG